MKKIYFLLSILFIVAGFATKSQVLSCNADFSFQISNGNFVQFTSLAPGDASNTVHYWRFGDGINGNGPFPSHTYINGGTYNVTHIVYRHNSTGTVACVDSLVRQVHITSPTVCNLVANFYQFRDTSAPNLYSFYFVNTSANVSSNDSIKWTFGDGSSSNQFNTYHSYSQPGTYNVCLRIIRRGLNGVLTNCVSEICHTITIPTNACNLVAAFVPGRDSLSTIPYTWYFYNTSLNASPNDSIRWTFGDGTSSNQYNAHHSYTQPGTYTVCLRIIRRTSTGLTNCVSEKCHTIIVQQPCNLQAAFNIVRDTASTIPFTYHFINTSVNVSLTDSIRWTFGDGTSSNQFSPHHSYAQPGTYTICLKIIRRTNSGTTYCVSESCRTITIPPVCNLNPRFIWRADSLNNNKIHFTNTTIIGSTNAFANWSFGDGTSASSWNAVHEYAQPGRYYVCLVVYVSNTCVASYCDSITVHPRPVSCLEQSYFSFNRVPNDSTLYKFTPAFINPNWLYTWTFGDGTGSQAQVVTHRYPGPGTYNACLTVYRNPNCASTTCKPVAVLNCATAQVNYTYYHDSPAVNRVHFNAISTVPIVSQKWTITRLVATVGYPITINQNNPVYTFSDTGYFKVCLRATLSNGCVKEICKIIYIRAVVASNACNMQVYPNPATTQINAVVQLAVPQMIDVYIYNMLNVMVREKHQPGVAGSNTVSVLVGDLPAGMYRLTMIHGGVICSALFQKL